MTAGVLIVLVVFYDLFQSVILPRPAVRKVQLARLVIRPMWKVWRWFGLRSSSLDRSEARLAAFGPIALVVLFAIWGLSLVLGYGLIIYGVGGQFRPELRDLPTSLYVSASTLVPLAYGDFVPEHGVARGFIIFESATGVGLAALVITSLFGLYGAFRSREEAVVALEALAGAPASALQVLETSAEPGMHAALKETFDEWRRWSAMVLETHLAYPLLAYFRSSHDNEAWINSFGAVMDAAALVISSVDEESVGAARLMFTVGNHLVDDIAWVFRFKAMSTPIIERSEYTIAVGRLKAAGYRVRDADTNWQQFADLRAEYASILNQMAHLLVAPPAPWVGDRSYLPHRQRAFRRKRAPTSAT